jgi:hypothetical protein
LEGEDVVPNSPERPQVFAIGSAPGVRQLVGRHANLAGFQPLAVKTRRVIEHSRHPASFYVGADSLDDLRGRERFAKRGDRASAPFRAHHVSARAQLSSQGENCLAGIVSRAVDSTDIQSGWHRRSQDVDSGAGQGHDRTRRPAIASERLNLSARLAAVNRRDRRARMLAV